MIEIELNVQFNNIKVLVIWQQDSKSCTYVNGSGVHHS